MDYSELYGIVEAIAAGKCAIFVGAGLSMAAGLPGWNELMTPLAQRLGARTGEHDFLTVAQAYEQTFTRKQLLNAVADAIRAESKPSASHTVLGSLASLGVGLWVTTNFDRLLEQAFRTAGLSIQTVVQNSDIPGACPGRTVLIKVHGDVTVAESIVLTKNDYHSAPLDRSLLWNKLASALAEYSFVFVGYSFRDPDFDQLQAQLLHRLGSDSMPRSYALMFETDHVARADLRSRNIQVIDLGKSPDSKVLHHFLSTVAQLVSQFPIPRPEHHDAGDARKLVPTEVQQQLENDGFALVASVEYLVYCDYVDDSPSLVPPGWRPEMPRMREASQYVARAYSRQNASGSQRWEGLAIGRARSGTGD